MANKLVYADYDEDSGKSTVIIRNKYGTFEGNAYLNPEDKDIASKYAGCRYAEIRADLKSVKTHLKKVNAELETIYKIWHTLWDINNHSWEDGGPTNKAVEHIYKQLINERDRLRMEIAVTEASLKNQMIERDTALSKYKNFEDKDD